MQNWFTYLFIGMIASNLHAQSTFEPPARNSIHFTPFNMIDWTSPSVHVGYQRLLNERFAGIADFGLVTHRSFGGFLMESFGLTYALPWFKGWKGKLEGRYYLKDLTTSENAKWKFLSAEIFYDKCLSQVFDDFSISDTSFQYSDAARMHFKEHYTEEFIVVRSRTGFCLKVGVVHRWSDKLMVEAYCGIGIIYRNAVHRDRENLNDNMIKHWYSFHIRDGKSFLPYYPLNFRFVFGLN